MPKKEYIGKMHAQHTLENRWWVTSPEELPNNVAAVVRTIEESQSSLRTHSLKYARLYANQELMGFLTGGTVRASSDAFSNNRVTFNVVKATIDTVQAKIAKTKPKVQFLTEDGDWALKQRAQGLTQYMEGIYYDNKVYEKAQKAFIHACVFGTGCLKVYHEDGKIQIDNVFIEEIKVDDIEGAYGKPRQLHQVKHISRDVLIGQFPEKTKEILSATSSDVTRGGTTYIADMLKVTESWHLPSSLDSNDGRHSISIEGCTLFDEEYKKSYFPFVFFRWSERLAGFFGQGLAEELIGIQIEINKLLKTIQKAQHLMAVPRVAVDQSSKLSTAQINNEIGAIFKYAGNPPTFFTPTAMNAEVYNHLKWLIQSAFEVSGISQLSATGKKPAGLDAAVALREYQDIETERFMITAQRYEQMFLDLADIVIDISRDLYSRGQPLKIKVQTSKFIKTIDWKDIDLEDTQFVLKMFPVSLLPSTPAGRIQAVQELINAGFIGKEQALSLLDFPDLDRLESLETSALNLTEKQLYLITEEGKYSSPEPQQNLAICKQLAQQVYLKGKLNKLSEDRLELLLLYIDDTERLIKQTEVAAPEAPGATPVGSTLTTAALEV
jgi:hypothetical protein